MNSLRTICVVTVSGVCLKLFHKYFLAKSNDFFEKAIDLREYGNWAVIVNGHDALGSGFAYELASLKLNILFLMNQPCDIDYIAFDIRRTYKVMVQTCVIDFSSEENVLIDLIEKYLKGLDVAILVNNFNECRTNSEEFLSTNNDPVYLRMINENILCYIVMTNIVKMYMRKKHKGVIINVSSVNALIPSADHLVFGATKSFAHEYSRMLYEELRGTGVFVQCFVPGPLTPLNIEQDGDLIASHSRHIIRNSLKYTGYSGCYMSYRTKLYVFIMNGVNGFLSTLRTVINLLSYRR